MTNKSFIENEIKGAPKNLLYIIHSLRSLKPENKNIRDIYRYMNESPGKILRPSILFLLCHEYKVKITKDIRLAALAIEMMHNATLLQDDVFDNEHIRRKKPSANIVFGNTRTLLVSDYLLVKAMDLLRDIKNEKIKDSIYKSAIIACSGEMDNCDLDIPEKINLKKYMSIIEQKTASLFRVCGEIVNIHLTKNKDEIISFTGNFGLLYQILDDLCDAELLLKSNRTDYTLKDIICLPLVFLMRIKDKSVLRENGMIASGKILREMKKEITYDKSLHYVRRRFGACMQTLKKQNELLYIILESFYSNIEEFLCNRCKG
jgi:geranylgeranyl pyrophosphate synthase